MPPLLARRGAPPDRPDRRPVLPWSPGASRLVRSHPPRCARDAAERPAVAPASAVASSAQTAQGVVVQVAAVPVGGGDARSEAEEARYAAGRWVARTRRQLERLRS